MIGKHSKAGFRRIRIKLILTLIVLAVSGAIAYYVTGLAGLPSFGHKVVGAAGLWFVLSLSGVYFLVIDHGVVNPQQRDIFITDDICIPPPASSTERGGSWFLNRKMFEKSFSFVDVNYGEKALRALLKQGGSGEEVVEGLKKESAGGLVVKIERLDETKERYHFCAGNAHSLVIGSTRSNKTRSLIMPTIYSLALAGESMVITDTKKEICLSTAGALRSMGYKTYIIDFKTPEKSCKVNPLKPVIDAFNAGDLDKAEMYALDVAENFVGNDSHSEKIWSDGEKATIAGAILSVVQAAKGQEEYQNLACVYWHISSMSDKNKIAKFNNALKLLREDDNSELSRLGEYIGTKASAVHLAAPDRTKGSFDTGSLITLSLYSSSNIYRMTHASDFDYRVIGKEKTAVFIVLPDERSTFYSIATLIVSQIFEALIEQSDKSGGVLPVRVNFLLDEFGNFTKIKDFESKITMGAGRGIRFNLIVQNIAQIEQKYGKDAADTITSNCENWVYLQTNSDDTLKLLESRLGKYTIKTCSVSSGTGGQNNSANVSFADRPLLFAEEIARIQRPYHLLFTKHGATVEKNMMLEDTYIDRVYGIGTEENARKMRLLREEQILENAKPRLPVYDVYKSFWSNVVEGGLRKNIGEKDGLV